MRPLVKHSVDTFVDWYLGYRLDRVLVEHRLVRLVHLLRGTYVFLRSAFLSKNCIDLEKLESSENNSNGLNFYSAAVCSELLSNLKFSAFQMRFSLTMTLRGEFLQHELFWFDRSVENVLQTLGCPSLELYLVVLFQN